MATTYYAATAIEHGKKADADGNVEVVRFEQDEKVTGLDEKTMRQLWENGALYKKEGSGDDAVQVTSSTGDVPGQPTPEEKSASTASGAGSSATSTTPTK